MSLRSLPLLFGLCYLAVAVSGCSSKGGMEHVKVETTGFAADKGLTVKDWSWSGEKFAVQFSASDAFTGKWRLFVQRFDTEGKRFGPELEFMTLPVKAGETSEWVELPGVNLREQVARVVFDIQGMLSPQREPHY